jgi:hypothetical protein
VPVAHGRSPAPVSGRAPAPLRSHRAAGDAWTVAASSPNGSTSQVSGRSHAPVSRPGPDRPVPPGLDCVPGRRLRAGARRASGPAGPARPCQIFAGCIGSGRGSASCHRERDCRPMAVLGETRSAGRTGSTSVRIPPPCMFAITVLVFDPPGEWRALGGGLARPCIPAANNRRLSRS